MPGFNGTGPGGRDLCTGSDGSYCPEEEDYKIPGYGPAMWWDIPAARLYASKEEELADLRCRAQMLAEELEMVKKRIAALEKEVPRNLAG
jgi:hypothetical protein